jgi:hypothetical protein
MKEGRYERREGDRDSDRMKKLKGRENIGREVRDSD